MKQRSFAWFFCGAVTLCVGCAEDNSNTSTSGSSDASGPGSGASGGSGGSGTGATGGDGGAGATGGASGGSSSGGAGGGGVGGAGGGAGGGSGGVGVGGMGSGGGMSGGVPQCTDANQCQIVNDCCTCAAMGPGEVPPPCNILCLQPKCSEIGVPAPVANCVVGQCVADLPCDHTKVVCLAPTPACPPGHTALVEGGCWTGQCGEADECALVGSCMQCSGGQACVSEITQIGPFAHCVDVDPSCGGTATCACMGGSVCVGSFDSCADANGEIQCSCPAC